MQSEFVKRVSIFLMLGLLTVSAFFIRFENFKNSRLRSIDEIVYFRMAGQVLDEGLSGYHTMPYGREMADAGRPLPDYFFRPLFKHPPVFTFLIALSMKIFGGSLTSAGYVSLLLGALMIPLVYILASLVLDRKIGMFSAIFMWLDPISIICSQKVWMDAPIAFFTFLSALLFIWGIKRGNDWLFIFSGLAGGLAANTKYTGILVTFAIALFCFLYRRDLFERIKFQLGLALPFLMLAPWLYWNYKVYGAASVLEHSELRSIYAKFAAYAPVMGCFLIIILAVLFALGKYKKNIPRDKKPVYTSGGPDFIRVFSVLIPIAFFIFIVPKQFLHSLQFTYLPTHTWQQGLFSNESASFYFGRLLEYSPIYIFSFLAVFIYHSTEEKETAFIRICAMIIFLFFVFWGNFQSRYILSSLPFLIILGAQFGMKLYEKVSASENVLVSRGGRAALGLFLVYAVLKIYYLNQMISYSNDMCYF